MRNGHPVEPEELMAYMDGELPVERASAAAGHMASCEECRKLAADLRCLSVRLAEWEVEDAAVRVPAAEVVLPRRRRGWKTFAGWGAGLAAACLVLFVFALFRRPVALDLARTSSFLVAPDQGGQQPQGPLIIRTAEIALATRQFDKTRAAIDDITRRHNGYAGQLSLNTSPAAGRVLTATLHIPSPQLDQVLAELWTLGRIESESQSGENVSQQALDLDVRLVNTQATEARLRDLLRRNTGNITDILAVEKELTRVREEIERMQAERKNLRDRVSFARLNMRVTEEYTAQVHPLRDAAAEGWRNLTGGIVGFGEFLLAYGLSLVFWTAVLFFPVRYLWRRLRRPGRPGGLPH